MYILIPKFKQTVVVLVLKLVECVLQPVRRDLGAAGGAVPGALSPGLSAIRVDGVARVQRQVRTRPTEPHQRGWSSSVSRRKSSRGSDPSCRTMFLSTSVKLYNVSAVDSKPVRI